MIDRTDKGTTAAEILEKLQSDTYKAFNVDSKPAGPKWIELVLDLAERILKEPGLLDAITDKELEQLTADNYHTARHAAETVLHLRRYTI